MPLIPRFLLQQVVKRCRYLAAIPGGAITPSELIPHAWKGKRALAIRERHADAWMLEGRGYRLEIPAHAYEWVSVFVGEIMLSDIYRLGRMNPPPGSFIYDCGANVGVFTVAAALAYPQCRILALEPEGQNKRYLERNIALNNLQERVVVLEAAVHRYDDEASLILHSSGDHYLATGTPSANGQGTNGHSTALRVRTVSLNRLAAEYGPVGGIKMDVQGAELEAVLGADQLLHTSRPAWSIAAYHDPHQLQALTGLLRYYGYDVRVHPGGYIYASADASPRNHAGDSVLVRQDEGKAGRV